MEFGGKCHFLNSSLKHLSEYQSLTVLEFKGLLFKVHAEYQRLVFVHLIINPFSSTTECPKKNDTLTLSYNFRLNCPNSKFEAEM